MEKEVRLQGISKRYIGTQTKNFKIGDVIIWNYGYKSEVVGMIPSKTKKSYKVLLKSLQDYVIRERTLKANHLLVVE